MTFNHAFMTSARLILAASILLVTANSASAHTKLRSAVPAANTTVNIAPKQLVLNFAEPVMLMGIKLINAKKNNINLNYKVTADTKKTHTIAIPKLANSTYNVTWTIIGKDGHRVSGKYHFTLKSPSSQD